MTEPLPSFEGEPKPVGISGTIDGFTDMVWNSLNEDNEGILFVRFIDIASGTYETRINRTNKKRGICYERTELEVWL